MASDLFPVTLEVAGLAVRETFERCLSEVAGFQVSEDRGEERLIVLELGEDVERDLQDIERILDRNPGIEVFLTAPRLDQAVLLRAMRAGVKECFPQPVREEEVKAALARLKVRVRTLDRPGPVRQGFVTTVCGSKCGVGITTLAVNLAGSFLDQPGIESVALLDLNPTSAEAPLFLDLTPRYGWDEAVANLPRLDGSFLAGLMVRHDSGLHLLAAPAALDAPVHTVVTGLTRIIGLLRSMYDVVVIDGGDYLDEIAMRVAELSDVVLFVAAQNIAYLASAGKYLLQVRRSRVMTEHSLRVVVNRYLKDGPLPDASILAALGKEAFLRIPDDYPAALGAINHGRFLAESSPRSPATRAIADLAATLAGEHGFAVKRSGFLGLEFLSRPRELRRRAG